MGVTSQAVKEYHVFLASPGDMNAERQRLNRERMESKNPLFRHAASRAIDHILINIQAFGGQEEQEVLEKLLPEVVDKEGVYTRVEWTIERLKER